jgi:hypothetical protein
MHRIVLAILIVSWLASASLADLPAGATSLDADLVWDTRNLPSWVLSPDKTKIAYISKGALWLCDVTSGPPRKIADLPNTATMFMASPENLPARQNFNRLREYLRYDDYQKLIGGVEESVLSLAWAPDQSGVIYGVGRRHQDSRETSLQRVLFASVTGKSRILATIRRSPGARPYTFSGFHVARDQRSILALTGNRPMIWDVASGRPRVTPFDYLLPSGKSDRYLGVEMDSRQLVIVNGDFTVARQFGEVLREGRECDLVWSADEQFALCRVRDEYSSTKWNGFRINLLTGGKRALQGEFFADRFWFTGRGGELARAGILGIRYEHADNMQGGVLEIIPDGDAPPRTLAKFRFDSNDPTLPRMPDRPEYPLPVADALWERIVVALPREGRMKAGFLQYLIDRDGHKWPFPAGSDDAYIAPFQILAFVDSDRRLLARTDTQLFSFPLESIVNDKEQQHD